MFLYKGHSGLATIYISWMVAETKSSCKICNVRKDSAVSYLRLRIQISEITNFLGTISYPELRQFYVPSRKSVKLRRQPAEKKQKLQRGSCTTIKLQLYNYRVYSCTTKGVTVVRQQGVPTRLDRGADCSQQTCRLGSAGLSSLVATMEKLLPTGQTH